MVRAIAALNAWMHDPEDVLRFTVARIEVEPHDLLKVIEHREAIFARFKELGYTYVTLDLEGYRSGKMNDTLKQEPALVPLSAITLKSK